MRPGDVLAVKQRESVTCSRCGVIHDVATKTFAVITGDIFCGSRRKISCTNPSGEVVAPKVFCYPDCLSRMIDLSLTEDQVRPVPAVGEVD